jgi:hypothetical protein
MTLNCLDVEQLARLLLDHIGQVRFARTSERRFDLVLDEVSALLQTANGVNEYRYLDRLSTVREDA